MAKVKIVYAIRVAYLLITGIVTFLLFQTVSSKTESQVPVETNWTVL